MTNAAFVDFASAISNTGSICHVQSRIITPALLRSASLGTGPMKIVEIGLFFLDKLLRKGKTGCKSALLVASWISVELCEFPV